MNPRTRDTIFIFQIALNIIALGIVIALLFTTVAHISAAASAQTEANRELIRRLQAVFVAHASASTRQNCAIASEIAFLVEASPKAPPLLITRLHRFVHGACQIEIVPPLGPDGQPIRSTPSVAPSSQTPTVGPTVIPPPTTPPPTSPTPTCLPVIGCL